MHISEKFFLHPGQIFVSEKPYVIQTVLGSCVSVCIWDTLNKCGGINHFIYSRYNNGDRNCKYGDISTAYLIKLLKEMGSDLPQMKAHIIGGGRNQKPGCTIGDENVKVAEEILSENKIEIVTKDVGGTTGRKVVFHNQTGEMLVYKGINIRESDWYSDDGK
jgi:chemotaxis protein CheD